MAAFVVVSVLLVDNVGRRHALERANQDVTTERDRLQRLTEFQEQILANLDAQSFGERLRAGLRREVEASLTARGRSAAEVAEHVASLVEAVAPANFTDLGVEAIYQEVLRPARDEALGVFEKDPVLGATMLEAVADALQGCNRLEEEHRLRIHVHAARTTHLGEDHRDTLRARNGLGSSLRAIGRPGEAETCFRDLVRDCRRVRGAMDRDTLTSLCNLGEVLIDDGRPEEALPYLEEALRG